MLDPFGRGPDAQTVAVYEGAASVRAPFSPQIAQFPEHRPFAAFDGDVSTTWIADPTLDDPRHWVEAKLDAPRDVPYVDLLPDASNPLVVVTRVDVGGRSFAVHPGWNRLPVRLRGATSVRVTITGHRTLGAGRRAASAASARCACRGCDVRELLRPPVGVERALAGQDLTHTPLTYVFERTTADDPLRRGPEPPASSFTGNRAEDEAALVRTAVDPEAGLDRVFSPPARAGWRADAWVTVVAVATPDPALDRLAGGVLGGASCCPGRAGSRAGRGGARRRRSTAMARPRGSRPGRAAARRSRGAHRRRGRSRGSRSRGRPCRLGSRRRCDSHGLAVGRRRWRSARTAPSRCRGRPARVRSGSTCSPRAARRGRRWRSAISAEAECRGSRCRAPERCAGAAAT